MSGPAPPRVRARASGSICAQASPLLLPTPLPPPAQGGPAGTACPHRAAVLDECGHVPVRGLGLAAPPPSPQPPAMPPLQACEAARGCGGLAGGQGPRSAAGRGAPASGEGGANRHELLRKNRPLPPAALHLSAAASQYSCEPQGQRAGREDVSAFAKSIMTKVNGPSGNMARVNFSTKPWACHMSMSASSPPWTIMFRRRTILARTAILSFVSECTTPHLSMAD